MKFSTLAEYFEKLEATSSRLSLIEILSELFKQIESPEEVQKVCYLVQGRIVPFFEPLEIGMADKTVAEAIARAYGSTKEEVLKLYSKVGDMGLVARKLAYRSLTDSERSHLNPEQPSPRPSPTRGEGDHGKVTVRDVFDCLTQIAKTSGDGTVEKKITLFSDLLKKVDSTSAKFLVRIPLANLRLGIGDPTVLDALATVRLGDKKQRHYLEDAYNRTSDLGLIAKTLWATTNAVKAVDAVEKLEVTVGHPIRSELCERLPNPEKTIEKMGTVDSQPKYDGFRCVTGFTPIYLKRKGISSVRDIKVGDMVLTQTGSFKKVLAKQKRTIKKKEKLFAFQTYLGEEVKISEGHPVLAFANNSVVWKPIETIKSNDEVVFPLPIFPPNNPHPAPTELHLQTISGYKKNFILNEEFYQFLGFWIGDGFTNDFHNTERIGLTFNAKTEKVLADQYEKKVKNIFQIKSLSRYVHNGGLNLYWRDEPFKHWLSTYFRRAWEGKMLPEWFSHIKKEEFKAFLQGWIDSDGTVDKDGVTKIVTKERDLAAFAQLIALSFGIVMGLHYSRVKNKTYYVLVIPKSNQKARIEGKWLIVKVLRNKEIVKRDPRIQLYDLQIEKDESFCAPLVTLHNCQIHKNGDEISLFSRNLENMTHMFPELIEGAKRQIKARTAILDSEALAYNPASEEFLTFQETTKRRRKHNIEEMAKELPLKAFVFDILYKDGKPLINEPLSKRLEILAETVEKDDTLFPAQTTQVSDAKKLALLLDDAISKGLEGIVVKKLNSPYEAGARNFNWVKLKRHQTGELKDTIDCVVLGYIYGKGKRTAFGAGALLVGVYDKANDMFVTVSKIGTGLSDEEWKSITERAKGLESEHKPARVESIITPSVWLEPKLVIEVLADEITRSPIHTAGREVQGSEFVVRSKNQRQNAMNQEPTNQLTQSGYALRFPRLVSFRDKDKKAEDATSVDELIEMYKEQGKK